MSVRTEHIILPVKSVGKVQAELQKILTPDNYGPGEGQWSVADVLSWADPVFRMVGLSMINGDRLGGNLSTHRILDETGGPMRFRVKVLTRHACDFDADGKPLSRYEMPQHVTPEPGDVVRVKSRMKAQPDGKALTAPIIRSMAMRGEDYREWQTFRVDEQGCITCVAPAVTQLLEKHGKRLVYPEWKRDLTGKRTIANWWFEEIFSDEAADEPPKRGKK
jgi:hypothetical protein